MKFLINLCTFVGETKIQETGLYNWYCICLKTAHNMPRWKKEDNCGNNLCAPCPNTAWPLPVAVYHSLPLRNVLSNKQVKTLSSGAGRRQAVSCPSDRVWSSIYIFCTRLAKCMCRICRFPQHVQNDKSLRYSQNITVIIKNGNKKNKYISHKKNSLMKNKASTQSSILLFLALNQ